MWLKKFAIVFVLIYFSQNLLVNAQSSAMSSTDWESQKILKSMMDHENRVRSLVNQIQIKINASIDNMKTNNNLALIVATLQNVRTFLTDLSTVDNYPATNVSTTCDDVALKIASIPYDILNCYRINFQVIVNATVLLVQYNNLHGAYYTSYVWMTDSQRRNVQSILTSLFILVDEYNQYSFTLIAATFKYSLLSIELTFCKRNYCSCPSQLSGNSSAIFRVIDGSIVQIQINIEVIENVIRNISSNIIEQINAINAVIQNTSYFLPIVLNLDSIATLLNGYLNLTTADVVNTTVTCDDAAMKVAYIEYKIGQYCQTKLEAETNMTFVLFQLNILLINYAVSQPKLSDTLKRSISSLINSIMMLVDQYTQYILGLCSSEMKLILMLCEAKLARFTNCNCTQRVNASTTSPQITTTTSKI